ncbi:MAG TPA: DUF362 domain-containing protein [Methanosarcinales archaeon]|nr:DUF362 domain-containing protein [Methanosarcinales archaeon]
MSSEIIFKNARFKAEDSVPRKIIKMLESIISVEKGDLVAIKIHCGEHGNTAYIRPVMVRTVVDLVKSAGGRPFVTETTTLYKKGRFDAKNLIETAAKNGFTMSTIGAPFIVANGLRGEDGRIVKINGKILKEIRVASAIAEADSMIVLSHGKGHPFTGFSGAIKHLGMGCLDNKGKSLVHEPCIPFVSEEKCIGCGKCHKVCAWKAVVLNKVAKINQVKCRGELACATHCPVDAIKVPEGAKNEFLKILGEAALGPIKVLNGKITYINFLYDITPACDCFAFSDAPYVNDIGMIASKDPVAIDAASIDLINKQPFTPHFMPLETKHDKFKTIWGVDPWIPLKAAEKIGAGKLKYKIVHNL